MSEALISRLYEPKIQAHAIADDGTFPNNRLPLVIYSGAFEVADDPAEFIERLFIANRWEGTWRNGIFAEHHYHSTAHEVLGIVRGTVRARLGGPLGIWAELRAGDAVLIPAGVAHKKESCSPDLLVVGAYPLGQAYDMCYGKPGERPSVDQNISRVPLPKSDPLYGPTGPLLDYWKG